jgi:hypothetical protein
MDQARLMVLLRTLAVLADRQFLVVAVEED